MTKRTISGRTVVITGAAASKPGYASGALAASHTRHQRKSHVILPGSQRQCR